MDDNSSLSAKEWAEKRFHDIETICHSIPGQSSDINPLEPPEWYDQQLFRKGQKLIHEYFTGITFASAIGVIFTFFDPIATTTMLATNNSSTIPKLYKRYLSTIMSIHNWHDYDPFDPESKSHKTTKRVRALHKYVSNMMNQKYGFIPYKSERVWISQYEMVNGQFAFIGFANFFSRECGIHISDDERYAINHLWRVIGYCLGIEDRFNLFGGDLQQNDQFSKLIFYKIWRRIMIGEKPRDPLGIEVSKGMCIGINRFAPSMHWNVMMKYWGPIMDVDFNVTLKTFQEKVWYFLIKLFMNYLSKYWIFRRIFDYATRKFMSLSYDSRDKVFKQLTDQYGDIKYERGECPVINGLFNYTQKFKEI